MKREEEMLLLIEQAIVLAEGNEWGDYLIRCLSPAKFEIQRQLGKRPETGQNHVQIQT